ncbi:MAG TPA: glycosyltransferase family protein, partial [Patescibacteria group bacterium]|nr:glycosyltransferase family protein [Patescibacteria group bacterium]
MKILYAVQGTGNGHVSRAREIIPHLQNHGEVDVVISGTQSQVELPIEPKYRRKGFTFVLGKHGGIDLLKSLRCVSFTEFIRDIKTLPVHAYDLVISDFEPVSAWACQLQGKECIALGHQSSFFSSKTPRPHKKNIFGELALKYFAPAAHHF